MDSYTAAVVWTRAARARCINCRDRWYPRPAHPEMEWNMTQSSPASLYVVIFFRILHLLRFQNCSVLCFSRFVICYVFIGVPVFRSRFCPICYLLRFDRCFVLGFSTFVICYVLIGSVILDFSRFAIFARSQGCGKFCNLTCSCFFWLYGFHVLIFQWCSFFLRFVICYVFIGVSFLILSNLLFATFWYFW